MYKLVVNGNEVEVKATYFRVGIDSKEYSPYLDLTTANPLEIDEGDDIEFWVEFNGNWYKLFAGRLYTSKINERKLYKYVFYGYLSLAHRRYVNKIYTNTTVYDIVNDLLDTYMPEILGRNIQDPGIEIPYYKAVEKPLDVVFKELADLAGYVFFIDNDRVFHFEPEQYNSTNYVLKWFKVEKGADSRKMYNVIRVYGGNSINHGVESFTGDGNQTGFYLSYGRIKEPSDEYPLTITINGNPVAEEDYSINYETNAIIFNSPPASGDQIEVDYYYLVPIIAEKRDEIKVAEYGVREKVIVDENITTFRRAYEVATAYLNIYNNPRLYYKLSTTPQFQLNINDIITLDASYLGISGQYVIISIEHQLSKGNITTEIQLASKEVLELPEVLKELKEMLIQTRIKQFEGKREITTFREFEDPLILQDTLTYEGKLTTSYIFSFYPTREFMDNYIIYIDRFDGGNEEYTQRGNSLYCENINGEFSYDIYKEFEYDLGYKNPYILIYVPDKDEIEAIWLHLFDAEGNEKIFEFHPDRNGWQVIKYSQIQGTEVTNPNHMLIYVKYLNSTSPSIYIDVIFFAYNELNLSDTPKVNELLFSGEIDG